MFAQKSDESIGERTSWEHGFSGNRRRKSRLFL